MHIEYLESRMFLTAIPMASEITESTAAVVMATKAVKIKTPNLIGSFSGTITFSNGTRDKVTIRVQKQTLKSNALTVRGTIYQKGLKMTFQFSGRVVLKSRLMSIQWVADGASSADGYFASDWNSVKGWARGKSWHGNFSISR